MSLVSAFLFHLGSTSLSEIHFTLLLFVAISFECCRYFSGPCRLSEFTLTGPPVGWNLFRTEGLEGFTERAELFILVKGIGTTSQENFENLDTL